MKKVLLLLLNGALLFSINMQAAVSKRGQRAAGRGKHTPYKRDAVETIVEEFVVVDADEIPEDVIEVIDKAKQDPNWWKKVKEKQKQLVEKLKKKKKEIAAGVATGVAAGLAALGAYAAWRKVKEASKTLESLEDDEYDVELVEL